MLRQWTRIPLRSGRKQDVIDAITMGEEFTSSTGAMAGVAGTPDALAVASVHKLSEVGRTQWHRHHPYITYTVYSSGVPIGWRLRAGTWVEVMPAFPTRTEKRHMGVLRHGIEGWDAQQRLHRAAATARRLVAQRTPPPVNMMPSPDPRERREYDQRSTADDIRRYLNEYDEWFPPGEVKDTRKDNFEPDNGAPVRPGTCYSGEGAIYSDGYLRRKHGREFA